MRYKGFRIGLAFSVVGMAALFLSTSSVKATPISGTGFTVDVIAEKTGATPAAATNYNGLASWVWAEEGSPLINHPGFPTGGLFTSTKPDYLTQFQLQPYDQANYLVNGNTFTLDTPASYSDLRFFVPGIGGSSAGDNFNATVNFTDGSSTALGFHVDDWQASRTYDASGRMAIVRTSGTDWDAYFGNGVFTRELDFGLPPADQAKLVESIDFTLSDRQGVAAVSGTLATSGPAAALTFGSRVLVSENNANFNISVFDGKAGYDNTGTTQTNPPLVETPFGDGTVEDYNFIVSSNGVTDPISYADGGAGLTPDPYDPNPGTGGWSDNSGQHWANVWTTSDPDTAPKDFVNGSITRTHAGHGEVQGTVDISGLESGTVYFPHGTYINQWDLTLTMTGAGQPALSASDAQTSNGAGTNFGWISDFSFTGATLYDTITYTYTNQDADGSRARFMGVILDGTAATAAVVPEPSTLTLTILGLFLLGLFGCRRRRRQCVIQS